MKVVERVGEEGRRGRGNAHVEVDEDGDERGGRRKKVSTPHTPTQKTLHALAHPHRIEYWAPRMRVERRMLWVGDDEGRRDVEGRFGADVAGLVDAEVVRFGGEVGGNVVCELASRGYGIGTRGWVGRSRETRER